MTTPYYKQHWIEIDAARLSVYESLLRYEPRMEPLLAPLDLQPGLSVLDVGSGPGSTTLELADGSVPQGESLALILTRSLSPGPARRPWRPACRR